MPAFEIGVLVTLLVFSIQRSEGGVCRWAEPYQIRHVDDKADRNISMTYVPGHFTCDNRPDIKGIIEYRDFGKNLHCVNSVLFSMLVITVFGLD